MIASLSIEARRLALQEKLDVQKTQEDRNRLGQFATPTGLALDILRVAKQWFQGKETIRFLDPAIGTGSFYSALLSVFSQKQIQWAKGFEIDNHYGQPAIQLWSKHGLDIQLVDFTKQSPPQEDSSKANLIVCNPPYVRHHHLSLLEKSRLFTRTLRASGVSLNGLAGLYCYFLCLCHAWLARNGIAIWLIPSEFMDVNYGSRIKEYLLEAVSLERIHRFDPSDMQFGDAIVSSSVVCFRNYPCSTEHVTQFTYGGTLSKPRVCRNVRTDSLEPKRKWTNITLASTKTLGKSATQLSDLFTIRRGIATGANNFFVLPERKANELKLPSEFLRPILPSPRYLEVDEIESDANGFPKIDRRLVLIDCGLPEKQVQYKYPELWTYLQEGITRELPSRYLCKHREPWYSQENRSPAPFLCTYMGRKKENGVVFRFILNHSQAVVANVYLMLYPKPQLAREIAENAFKKRVLWKALCSIDAKRLLDVGRVYGGGLHKVEPGELAAAPAEAILKIFPDAVSSKMTLFPM